MLSYLLPDQRQRPLWDREAQVAGGCTTEVAFLWLPGVQAIVGPFDLDERTA
jgi:hypothetical protein